MTGTKPLPPRWDGMDDPDQIRCAGDDRFPNSTLPILIYRTALPRAATAMEQAFAAQGWTGSWRNGIFAYHHFHSTVHEVLGIAAGRVAVLLGGPAGQQVDLAAGDVIVIPAGVAHRNMGQSSDLLVIGAYPGGAECDVLRGDPSQLAAARHRIASLPVPPHDPVPGHSALRRLWDAV